MENFTYTIPTTIYFGKGQVKQIGDIVDAVLLLVAAN